MASWFSAGISAFAASFASISHAVDASALDKLHVVQQMERRGIVALFMQSVSTQSGSDLRVRALQRDAQVAEEKMQEAVQALLALSPKAVPATPFALRDPVPRPWTYNP